MAQKADGQRGGGSAITSKLPLTRRGGVVAARRRSSSSCVTDANKAQRYRNMLLLTAERKLA